MASKTAMGGSRSPVVALRWLRSSTALSESKPDSRKSRSGSTASGPLWPSTIAEYRRTTSWMARFCSASAMPASCRRSETASAPPPAARRLAFGASPRSSAGGSPDQPRSPFGLTRSGTSVGCAVVSAASNAARPSSSVSAGRPWRFMRSRSASVSHRLSPVATSHRP